MRPGIMYRSVDRNIEQNMSIADMRILRLMSGVIKKDKIKNEYIKYRIGVASIVKKKWEILDCDG